MGPVAAHHQRLCRPALPAWQCQAGAHQVYCGAKAVGGSCKPWIKCISGVAAACITGNWMPGWQSRSRVFNGTFLRSPPARYICLSAISVDGSCSVHDCVFNFKSKLQVTLQHRCSRPGLLSRHPCSECSSGRSSTCVDHYQQLWLIMQHVG